MRRLWALVVVIGLAGPAHAQTPPTGFTTVTPPDWVQGGGVATAPATFGRMRWSAPFGPNQQAACTISAVPADNDTIVVVFRYEGDLDRYSFVLTRVPGLNNDTVHITKRVAGVTTTLTPVISLGTDIKVNDRIGVDVLANAIKGQYWSIDAAWNRWKTVAEAIAGTSPPTSYIGLGANAPVSCTLFAGQGAAASPDTDPPTPNPPQWQTPPLVVVSDTIIQVKPQPCFDTVGVVAYRFRRCATPACSPTVIVREAATPEYNDVDLLPDTLYRYTLECGDGLQYTSPSTPVVEARTLTAAPAAPGVPGGFSVLLGPYWIEESFSSTSLTISYTASTGNPAHYRIERGLQADCSDCQEICRTTELSVRESDHDSATCQEPVAYATQYFHQVRAADPLDTLGAYSSIVAVTTPPAAQFVNTSGRSR